MFDQSQTDQSEEPHVLRASELSTGSSSSDLSRGLESGEHIDERLRDVIPSIRKRRSRRDVDSSAGEEGGDGGLVDGGVEVDEIVRHGQSESDYSKTTFTCQRR